MTVRYTCCLHFETKDVSMEPFIDLISSSCMFDNGISRSNQSVVYFCIACPRLSIYDFRSIAILTTHCTGVVVIICLEQGVLQVFKMQIFRDEMGWLFRTNIFQDREEAFIMTTPFMLRPHLLNSCTKFLWRLIQSANSPEVII